MVGQALVEPRRHLELLEVRVRLVAESDGVVTSSSPRAPKASRPKEAVARPASTAPVASRAGPHRSAGLS